MKYRTAHALSPRPHQHSLRSRNSTREQKDHEHRKNQSRHSIHKILTLLPHRYPILLVDRVLELEPHKSIKALKNVSINEPYFMGHFPKRPVMPGVLILEALAQTAALLTFAEEPHDPDNTLYLFVGIDNARFKRVVEPGDQLILNVTFERHMRGIWKFEARAEVDGMVAAEAGLICTVRRADRNGQSDAGSR